MFTVVIPCRNEERWIGRCLDAIAAQKALKAGHGIQIIVAANACQDATVTVGRAHVPGLKAAGFVVDIVEIPVPGKTGAINQAETLARHGSRVYLDADVVVSCDLFSVLGEVLSAKHPVFVSAVVVVPTPKSRLTQAYARMWTRLPFSREVPGVGMYAVNASGRQRWAVFPAIYADDRFVRSSFAAHERHAVGSTYEWPLPEGILNLVRVQCRWAEGNAELVRKLPRLRKNSRSGNFRLASLFALVADPWPGVVFVTVSVLGRILWRFCDASDENGWHRGRL